MQTLPKLIVAIPAVILVLAIFMRLSGRYESNTPSYEQIPPSRMAPITSSSDSASSIQPSPASSSPIKLDLKGPFVCTYEGEEIQADLRIQNKHIAVNYMKDQEINHVIVNGDCLYKWKEGTLQGEKICGMGEYLSLFEMFSSFLSPKLLFSMMPQMEGIPQFQESTITSLTEGCMKEDIDTAVFAIPPRVTFTETSMEELQQ